MVRQVWIETTNYRKLEEAVKELRKIAERGTEAIGLVVGATGSGKTYALARLHSQESNSIYIRIKDRTSFRKLVEEIGKELGLFDRDEIIAYLRSSRTLLIIDEAQFLSQKTLEYLRIFAEDSLSPILLVDGSGYRLLKLFQKQPWFNRRIHKVIHFTYLTPAEVKAFCQFYRIDNDGMKWILERKWLVGYLQKLLLHADEIRQKSGERQISLKHILKAMKEITKLRRLKVFDMKIVEVYDKELVELEKLVAH